MKKLVIVESPAKSKTIEKYLGDDYKVMSSFGHIRDLATTGKGGLGIDVEDEFKPNYIISKDKKKVVSELKKAAKNADEILLATDLDREGEAISWHLAQELNVDLDKENRIVFNEITKKAILEAIENPLKVNNTNNIITNNAPTKPNSSQIIEKIKSLCGSGKYKNF